jgi:hypothetical protein
MFVCLSAAALNIEMFCFESSAAVVRLQLLQTATCAPCCVPDAAVHALLFKGCCTHRCMHYADPLPAAWVGRLCLLSNCSAAAVTSVSLTPCMWHIFPCVCRAFLALCMPG